MNLFSEPYLRNKVVCLTIFSAVLLIFVDNPFKVTEPNDPDFNIKSLDFCDYNELDFVVVLRKLIKPNMNKEKIDKILVGYAGLKSFEGTPITYKPVRQPYTEQVYQLPSCGRYFFFNVNGPPSFAVQFDQNNVIINARLRQAKLFPAIPDATE